MVSKVPLLLILVVIMMTTTVMANVYMHNPRGSNNRNCERNESRNNNNRLFDSQNNSKGGYACPRAVGGPEVDTKRMYYYQGSVLPIQWTMQHGCGINNNSCHVVLQYMCEQDSPGLRDGTPKDAKDDAVQSPSENNVTDQNVGLHESLEYYKKCQTRRRQGGLFLADRQRQNPGRLSNSSPATQTRQNTYGGRSGFECPEERDYYPYWHPTPWRDIAVFTNDMSQCDMYHSESQNVKNKGECWSKDATNPKYLPFNNLYDCVNFGNGNWVESGKFDIDPPQCLSTSSIASRDNYLGLTNAGIPATYNWVIPFDIESDACVLRIRYNISTDDVKYDLDYRANNENSPIVQDPLGSFGMGSTLSMAVNTDQFGRTFQDRSYVFSIKKRPIGVGKDAKIYNVNVIGKRGNIFKTFPAMEYRFVPEHLNINSDDFVHFQWTGSDYNPHRPPNYGEGGPVDPVDGESLRADRSNIVQIDYPGLSVPRPAQFNTMFIDPKNGEPDMKLINKLAFIDQNIDDTNPTTRCLTQEEIQEEQDRGNWKIEFDSRNCAKLNAAATPYFDAGLVKLHATGTFHYFSTRNNNFSNRGQKASITVASHPPPTGHSENPPTEHSGNPPTGHSENPPTGLSGNPPTGHSVTVMLLSMIMTLVVAATL